MAEGLSLRSGGDWPVGVGDGYGRQPWKTGAALNILVLDDHDGFRDEMVRILSRDGHAAQGAASAGAAVPLVEKGDFDFVLVDYHMPEHDGVWFLRNAKRPRKTKALLITAHVNRKIIDEMFKAGAVGYIIKPFDEGELLRNLKFHSERR